MPDQPDFAGYFQAYLDRGLTPQQAIQALEGVSPAGQAAASNWLKQQQLGAQGSSPLAQAARYPLMAGSQALTGLENTLSLPERGMDWVGRELGGGAVFRQPEETAAPLTNALGATNNLAMIPGYGPHPVAEGLLAAGARGIGGALPMIPLGPSVVGSLVPAAVGGVSGEMAHLALPESRLAPMIAGTAGAVMSGGLGQMFQETPEAAAVPTAEEAIGKVTSDLGEPTTTMLQAGQRIKNELTDRAVLASAGRGPGIPFSAGDMKSFRKLPPYKVAVRLARDPDNMLALRQSMPGQADALTAGVLNDRGISGFKGMTKSQEGLGAFLPDQGHQQMLQDAAKPAAAAAASPDSASHSLIAGGIGSIIGAGLTHMGYLPGGEFMGGEIGALGGYMAERAVHAVSNHVARSILAPWMLHAVGTGAAAGAAGGQPSAPVLPTQ